MRLLLKVEVEAISFTLLDFVAVLGIAKVKGFVVDIRLAIGIEFGTGVMSFESGPDGIGIHAGNNTFAGGEMGKVADGNESYRLLVE